MIPIVNVSDVTQLMSDTLEYFKTQQPESYQ